MVVIVIVSLLHDYDMPGTKYPQDIMLKTKYISSCA